MALTVRLAESLAAIEGEWRSSAPSMDAFLDFEFLDALERTGCVTPEKGWAPCHVVVEDDGVLVALMPAYLKGHSEGEFVFDWAWADAHARYGIEYYPKLLVGIPFTPATGARVLTPPGIERRRSVKVAAEALLPLAGSLGVSSVHVNFVRDDEADAFRAAGFIERHGIQLHWHREGGATLDDFLRRFDSKRRNQWKRETRRVEEAGVRWRRLAPAELTPERMSFVHRCYRATVDAHVYGRPYLNEAFFQQLAASPFRERLVVLVAERDTTAIAMTFNIAGGDTLYGRYWGAVEHVPFLHFVLGYAAAIETALAEGLTRIEPGAGGEHKQARGFDPAITRSMHWVREPRLARAIREHVAREREAIAQQVNALREDAPWHREAPSNLPDPSVELLATDADTFMTERHED
jgi:predicted N-acyltransferase